MWSLYLGIGYSLCLCAKGAKTAQGLSPKDRLSGHSLLGEPWRLAVFVVVTDVACHGLHFKRKALVPAR